MAQWARGVGFCLSAGNGPLTLLKKTLALHGTRFNSAGREAYSRFPAYSNSTEAKSRSATQVHIILRSE